jgi:Eukaryotic DNA topoisomerase I, DNA binding fragment
VKIKEFEQCDFTKIFEHFEVERARKKALSAAEKKEIKAKKDEAEAKYVYCMLDGRKEKVGNFRAEPPGLFRGRGEHPKKGALKVSPYCAPARHTRSLTCLQLRLDPQYRSECAGPRTKCARQLGKGDSRQYGDLVSSLEGEHQRQREIRLPSGWQLPQRTKRYAEV